MITAVIFDLDGVIVDTAHYHYLAWKRLAEELGFTLTEDQNQQLKGVSRNQSLEIVLKVGGFELTAEEKDRLANKKNDWFLEYVHQIKPADVFPGVNEMLKELKNRGLKIGLASSSKNAKTVIRLLGIEEYFDALVDGTMIQRTKPDPEIFLLAASLLNEPPDKCIVVEDAVAGIEAARQAGMKCIGIGDANQLDKADQVYLQTADINLSLLTTI